MIFCKYCPTRQHNPQTWIEDVTESETTTITWKGIYTLLDQMGVTPLCYTSLLFPRLQGAYNIVVVVDSGPRGTFCCSTIDGTLLLACATTHHSYVQSIVLEPCSRLIVQNNEAIDPLRWSVDGATPTGDVVCRFFSTKLTAVGRGQSPAQLVTNALYLVPVVSEEVTREHVTAIRTGICNPIQR